MLKKILIAIGWDSINLRIFKFNLNKNTFGYSNLEMLTALIRVRMYYLNI